MAGSWLARWATWLISLGLLCGVAWSRLDAQGPIQTNILNLLPAQSSSPALQTATERSHNEFAEQLLALMSGPDNERARMAALAARKAFLAAGLKAFSVQAMTDRGMAVYRRHHFSLLTEKQATELTKGGARVLASAVAVSLASPVGLIRFGDDPGGYLAGFLSRLPRPYPDFLPDGPLSSAGRGNHRVFLLRMELTGAAFAHEGSAQAARAVEAARNAVESRCADCRFEATGAALFSDSARREAKKETLWLTITSTVLIMLLIAFVYRSLMPHLLGFLQLFSSIVAAGAAVIATFGSINILTLVFGTTLLGIAIDYAFLYFAEYWFGTTAPRAVMRKIRGGLGIGLLTGAVAFAFLLFAGFPALTQIAIFSVAGLLEAALVVVLIFPLALTSPPAVAVHPAVNWPSRFIGRASHASRWRYVLPALALALAVPGLFYLQANDDVRELSHFPPRLVQADREVRTQLERFPASGFLLSEGLNLNQALVRESGLFGHVEGALPHADAIGLSRFLPPVARQRASLAAWRSVFDKPDQLRAAFTHLGLPAKLADRLEQAWHKASRQPLTAAELFSAVPDLKRFVITTSAGTALLGTVFGNQEVDSAALDRAAASAPGTRFVLPLERIDNVFAHIRIRATWLVVIGYLLISAILIGRYGYREAVRMLVPPLLALGLTLGALGWLGEPVNVFVVVALILILGLGRDYAVFLREVGARERSPALAVTMSAMTTLLSFGLLSLSRIPALHAFGLATLIGILASYLLLPLSLPPVRAAAR